jgi:hypothetical protein
MRAALAAAERAGFNHSFRADASGLRCLETNDVFRPEDVTIVNHQRFEGSSSADDMSVVYWIECKGGIKGTVVDAFGTYSDSSLSAFLHEVTLAEVERA